MPPAEAVEAVEASNAPGLVRREGRAMGSPLRLSVAVAAESASASAASGRAVEAAWDAVRIEFEACEAAMSRFRDDSELTALNRAGGRGREVVTRRLARALAAADRARRMTGGRFDTRVVDALEVHGFGAVEQGRPTEAWTPVDLGGIGKGLALRWAAHEIRRAIGPVPGPLAWGFLLEAGGDIVVDGFAAAPPDPWLVGIEDRSGAGPPPAVAALHGQMAIATSSVRLGRRVAADGRALHHLIDPATGQPGGAGLAAVSVAGPDPAWAEVWSKALFLEGANRIAAAARRRGLAAWWVTEEGGIEMTAGGRQRTAWVATEAGQG